MLRSKMMVLRQVLRRGSELQEVGVEYWHFWGDVVEEECLDQVRPVDLQGNFLKEVADIQVVFPDNVNNQFVFHGHLRVKFHSANGALGQAVAREWVEAKLRLGNIINNHDRVGENLEILDQVVEVC